MIIFKIEHNLIKKMPNWLFKNKYHMPFWHKITSKIYAIMI